VALPTISRRGAVRQTSNVTNWDPAPTWNVNLDVPAGQSTLWTYFVVADGTPTLTIDSLNSDANWQKKVQYDEATGQLTVAVFQLETTGAIAAGDRPAFRVNSSASEQLALFALAHTADSGLAAKTLGPTFADGNSTNSNPPIITNDLGKSIDAQPVVYRAGDGSTAVAAYPSGYSSWGGIAGSSQGVSVNAAGKTAPLTPMAASESLDPPVFSSTTEQWIAATLLAYQDTVAEFLYLGSGNRASRYVGSQTAPLPYVGAKALFQS
jgi:hypothetical protein